MAHLTSRLSALKPKLWSSLRVTLESWGWRRSALVGLLLPGRLGHGFELPELLDELGPLHPRGNAFSGKVFLHLAAGALAWCGATSTPWRRRVAPANHLCSTEAQAATAINLTVSQPFC